jgi:hypothetical protein
MTITNGYTTLDNIKNQLQPNGGPDVNATDDTTIEHFVEAASRYIDGETHRTFYGRAETHYFDAPHQDTLFLDDDLLSVTKLTNGDGVEITNTDYILMPANRYPKFAIRLRDTSSVVWNPTAAGSMEQSIQVQGTWGYSSGSAASTPPDVQLATEQIVIAAYRRKEGQNMTSTSTVTAAGVVITPEDIPAFSRKIIALKTRNHFNGA